MRALSRRELEQAAQIIAQGGWRQDVADLAIEESASLRPAEDIATAQCAEQYRVFPAAEGIGTYPYSIARTPYNRGPMDWLDDASCNLLVMVKPSRSGGTTIAENYLFRMIRFGPMGSVAWYLASDAAVKKYVDLIVKPMFELHPELGTRIGAGRSDNNDKAKRIAGHMLEYLSASDPNSFTNREPLFMVMDETDACRSKVADKPVVEIKARQKQLGRRKKAMVMSHPDKGWGSGVAAAWVDTSRGIFIMRCAECAGFAAAHATKHWPGVPEFKLDYTRDTDASRDDRLAMAKNSAGMACPHCGAVLTDAQRRAMIDAALSDDRWMHRGQTLDPIAGIVGEMDPTTDRGSWVHGLMLKTVTMAELAHDLEAAIIKWESTRRSGELKTFLARQLGEIYEGKIGAALVSSAALQQRARDERILRVGECPPQVRYITASVDLKAAQFDVSFRGWDLEGRSWWLDRLVIRQRLCPDGTWRDIRTRERIEDWDVLLGQVIDRKFPIVGSDGLAMPVAHVVIDVGDGNVVWKGREFARRAIMAGRCWGKDKWSVVRLTQGSPTAKTIEVPDKPTLIEKDQAGRPVEPAVPEYTIGSHRLKELAQDLLSVDDGGPGQCYFAEGISAKFYDEYFNERLVDGKWDVSGPNESLDLFAMEIAGRLMLRPDRKTIDWQNRSPLWARPVRIAPETSRPIGIDGAAKTPAPARKARAIDKFKGLSGQA